jgi:hypothetical protein
VVELNTLIAVMVVVAIVSLLEEVEVEAVLKNPHMPKRKMIQKKLATILYKIS